MVLNIWKSKGNGILRKGKFKCLYHSMLDHPESLTQSKISGRQLCLQNFDFQLHSL